MRKKAEAVVSAPLLFLSHSHAEKAERSGGPEDAGGRKDSTELREAISLDSRTWRGGEKSEEQSADSPIPVSPHFPWLALPSPKTRLRGVSGIISCTFGAQRQTEQLISPPVSYKLHRSAQGKVVVCSLDARKNKIAM